jgi:hypothetical protein
MEHTGLFQDKKGGENRGTSLDYRQGKTKLQYFCLSCLLVLSGCLLPAPSRAAETLDRLFFTPQDRIYMEKLRWATPESVPPLLEQQEKTVTREDKPQIFTLGGTVTKKNGVQALWLNSLKYSGNNLPANVELRPPFTAGQILLQVPETGMSYALRPGQFVDIGNGQIKESYQRLPATPLTVSKPSPASSLSSKKPGTNIQPPEVPPPLNPRSKELP